jgi:hypothetical protein
LPTNSLFPASSHPSHIISPPGERSSHLSWSFGLHIHQSPRHRIFLHSCNMTSQSQSCNSDYQLESGLFKKIMELFIVSMLPLAMVLNSVIHSSKNSPRQYKDKCVHKSMDL